jgi:hypothetical protein
LSGQQSPSRRQAKSKSSAPTLTRIEKHAEIEEQIMKTKTHNRTATTKTRTATETKPSKASGEQLHRKVASVNNDDEAQLRLATLRGDRERLRSLLADNYSRWRDDILRADNLGLAIADHIGLIDLVMTADWLIELQMADLRPVAGRYEKREEEE